MRAILKHVIRSSLDRAAYAVARPTLRRIAAELDHCQTMRAIRRQDAVELEELYRRFVFPDLTPKPGRAKLLHELIGTTIGEAIYIVHSLQMALSIGGDICEFGVAQGATSRLLASEVLHTDRKLWLFDSFEGLPEPSAEDKLIDDIFKLGSMAKYKGTMASAETEVLDKLKSVDFPRSRTKVKKGWIQDTIKTGDLPLQISFAYVDFDFYEPIKQALEFVDSRMPPGGRIVVDDYGFFSAGAQLAVDRFVSGANGRFSFELPLPIAGHFCVLKKLS